MRNSLFFKKYIDLLSLNLETDVVFILDDGHGWETAGKRSGDSDGDNRADIKENHFNEAAMRKFALLLDLFGFKYLMTAPEYWDKPLNDRTRIERQYTEANVTIFISFHANAANYKATGHESFVWEDDPESLALGKMIEEQLKMMFPTMRQRGVKISSRAAYNFAMLRDTRSEYKILLEAGFMTNARDRDLLMNDQFINNYILSVFFGNISFMRTRGLMRENPPVLAQVEEEPKENEIQVLTAAIRGDDDPLGAAKGCATSLIAGGIFWISIILIFVLQ